MRKELADKSVAQIGITLFVKQRGQHGRAGIAEN